MSSSPFSPSGEPGQVEDAPTEAVDEQQQRASDDDESYDEEYWLTASVPVEGDPRVADDVLPAVLWRLVAERTTDLLSLAALAATCRCLHTCVMGGSYDLSTGDGATRGTHMFKPMSGASQFAMDYGDRVAERARGRYGDPLIATGRHSYYCESSAFDLMIRRNIDEMARRCPEPQRVLFWRRNIISESERGVDEGSDASDDSLHDSDNEDTDGIADGDEIDETDEPPSKRARADAGPFRDSSVPLRTECRSQLYHDRLVPLLSVNYVQTVEEVTCNMSLARDLIRNAIWSGHHEVGTEDPVLTARGFDAFELHRHIAYALQVAVEIQFLEQGQKPLSFRSETDYPYNPLIFRLRPGTEKPGTSPVDWNSPEAWDAASDLELANALLNPQSRLMGERGERVWGDENFNSILREARLLEDAPFPQWMTQAHKDEQVARARSFKNKIIDDPRVDIRFRPRALAIGQGCVNPVPVFELWRLSSRRSSDNDGTICAHPYVVGVMSAACWT